MNIPVPEDLTTLSTDELNELLVKIAERAAELHAAGDFSDDVIAEADALADAKARIEAEVSTKVAAEADREARAAEVFGGLLAPPAEPEAAVEPEAPAEPVAEAPEAPVAELPTAPAPEPAPAPEAVAAAVTPPAPAPAAAPAPAPVAPAAGLTALSGHRPAAAAPAPVAPQAHGFRFEAAVGVPNVEPGTSFADRRALATAIADRRGRFGNKIASGVRDDVVVASGAKGDFDFQLTGDAVENFAVLEAARGDNETVVASGAMCYPVAPLVEFYGLAEAQEPMGAKLVKIQAPRGLIRFLSPVDYRAQAGEDAIGVVTAAEEAAGYVGQEGGTTPLKKVARVECPEVSEAAVDSIYHSIRWGNLQHKTFPELVDKFLADLNVEFASVKETRRLDYIDATSVQVTSTAAYGASRGLLYDWTQAAVGYRKRRGMKRDAMIQVVVPDWVIEFIKADMVNDGDEGLSFLSIPDSEVIAALRSRHLDPVFVNDTATRLISTQRWTDDQEAGALNLFPGHVTAYLYAPGTYAELDAGTLDVGIVRDSTLNRTNDLEMFYEEYLATVKLGIESVGLTTAVLANGAGAANKTPFS